MYWGPCELEQFFLPVIIPERFLVIALNLIAKQVYLEFIERD